MNESAILRILTVDDEDSFRLSLEMGLKLTEKYDVDSAECGEAAIEKMKTNKYDVILLDNKMPDLDGLEVVEWMHQNKIHTPVIMFTSMGSEEVIIEAMKRGVYDYLRKDQLQIGRLSVAIQSVHERHRYRQQLLEREAEEKLFRGKEKELEALKTLHATIVSVDQLLDRNMGALGKIVKSFRDSFAPSLKPEQAEKFESALIEIEKHIEAAVSGIRSIRDISALEMQKVDEIRGAFKIELPADET
jgi:DNA-binding response OmpR family regulator